MREFWETIKFKLYYAYVDVWYWLKHLPETIERVCYYLPLIVKMHDWDGNNVIYLTVAEVERLEHYYRDKDDILADESKDEILAQLQSAKVAGHRVIDGLNGEYLNELWVKHGIPENYFDGLTTKEALEGFYNNPTPEQEAIGEKILQAGKEEDKLLDEAERKYFDLLREHYKNWWS